MNGLGSGTDQILPQWPRRPLRHFAWAVCRHQTRQTRQGKTKPWMINCWRHMPWVHAVGDSLFPTTLRLMYMYCSVATVTVQLCNTHVHVLLCCSNHCTTAILMYMYYYVAAIAVQLCHADVHVLLCCSNCCTTLQYWCTCTAMLQQSLYNSAILMQESGDPRDRSEALKRYGHIISIVCIHIKLLLSVVYCMLVSPELSVTKKQCV